MEAMGRGERALLAASGVTRGFRSAVNGRAISSTGALAHELERSLGACDIVAALPEQLALNVLALADPTLRFDAFALVSGAWANLVARFHSRAPFVDFLPTEIALHVLSFLDARSLLAVGCTCRRLRALAREESLWAGLYRRIWFARSEATLRSARLSLTSGPRSGPAPAPTESSSRSAAIVWTTAALPLQLGAVPALVARDAAASPSSTPGFDASDGGAGDAGTLSNISASFLAGTPRSISDGDLTWRALVLARLRYHQSPATAVRRFARYEHVSRRLALVGGLAIEQFCAYRGWANMLLARMRDEDDVHGARLDSLMAEEGFATAIAIRPGSLFLYNDWALCVHTRAESELSEPVQRRLCRSSFALYALATRSSRDRICFCNWAYACTLYARLHDWPESKAFFEQAVALHAAAATTTGPLDRTPIFNWSMLLLDYAEASPECRDDLFSNAYTQIERVRAADPTDIAAIFQLGSILQDHGKRKRGSERAELYARAEAHYREVLERNPDFVKAKNNVAIMLLDHAAALRDDVDSERLLPASAADVAAGQAVIAALFARSRAILDEITEPRLQYRWGLYSLARWHAVVGDSHSAQELLERFCHQRTLNPLTVRRLVNERRLDLVRRQRWFAELAQRLTTAVGAAMPRDLASVLDEGAADLGPVADVRPEASSARHAL